MMKLYSPPQKIFLPLNDHQYQENSIPDKEPQTSFQGKNVLYKQISPRRRFNKFGIDKTDYKAFALSSTVYPTAVKATLLAELQGSNPHKCGFDIVERPKEVHKETIDSPGSKASSMLNAPPPTAEQSHRGPGSSQSAPIVAFVEIPSATNMPGTRRTSYNSKSAATSVIGSEVNVRAEDPFADGPGNDDNEANNGDDHNSNVLKSDPVPESADPTNRGADGDGVVTAVPNYDSDNNNDGNFGLAVRQQQRLNHDDLVVDTRELDEMGRVRDANRGSVKMMQQRLHAEKQWRSDKGKENRLGEAKVLSYSRLDCRRLIRYQWQSRESRTAEERKDGGDIRDTMYINTFCADERPVRFHKISLPHLSRSSRPRPWTVGESSISNRTALLMANRRSLPASKFSSRAQSTSHPNVRVRTSWAAKNDPIGLPNVLKRPGGILKLSSAHGHKDSKDGRVGGVGGGVGGGGGSDERVEDGDDVEEEEDPDGAPLLDIRSCLANSGITDQRDKLKGKDGCLNSRVKQCVRFVRYRERFDKQEEHRPMKSEGGRYRPFSKTDVRNHGISNPPPTPEQRLQQSVETYQKYMENIAHQTNVSSPRPFTFRGHSTGSTRPAHASLTTASSAIDTDSMIVQSVLDSNRPDATSAGQSRASLETPRPQNSAIYTKDMTGVHNVLDIKRLSPKVSTNRIVPGTRVAHEKPPTPTPRYPSASTDEGVDMAADTAPPSSRGDAIVVPMGTKSECPSDYSVSKDD